MRRLLLACGCRNVGVLLVEAFHAARGVDEFLFAGEERMATRTDFDAQHIALNGRTGLKGVPASAVYGYGMIVGVNTGFHDSPFCRVRSARHPGGQRTTAASLGHETNNKYKAKRAHLKIWVFGAVGGQEMGTTAVT